MPLHFPTKPPPSRAGPALPPKPSVVHSFRELGVYKLPMFDEDTPSWQKILRNVGYPETVVTLDFETFFSDDYGMGSKATSLSTVEYVTDKRFEAVGLGRLVVAEPFPNYELTTNFATGEAAVLEDLQWLQKHYGENLERCTVVAHNALFELTVLAWRYEIFPPFIIDTLGLARHWNARSNNDLDSLCSAFKLPAKGDTSQFSGVTMRHRWMRQKGKNKSKAPISRPLATQEQLIALAGYGTNDVLREWELFTVLLPKLSNPATELRIMLDTLEMFTRPVLGVDQERGAKLMLDMDAEIDNVVSAVTVKDVIEPRPATREDISGNITFERMLTRALEDAGDNPQKYFKFGKKGAMLAIAKADDEREVLLKHPDPTVRGLMEARIALKSWPLHIARVDRIMRQSRAAGGLMPVPLKYHGAHTGRDAGGEKVNLQNLPVR